MIKQPFQYAGRESVGNSLQDQFLKMGLVDKGKANQVTKEKRKKAKQSRKGGVDGKAQDAERRRLQEEEKKRTERDRQLNRERVAETERKALVAQVRQLIEMNQVSLEGGDEPYNFTDGSKLKRLYLPHKVHQQVTNGRLAIAKLDGGYAVVPVAVAEKINLRDGDAVLVLNAGSDDEVDDEYAEFKVPDDLMW